MSTPRAMTHSSLDLFDRVPILEPIECSNTQKIYPTNSLNESSLEFQFESDRNMMIDLQETFLFLKVKLSKGNVALEAADDAMFVNNTMHSLFSNCEVYFNNEQVYTSNGLYAHKAFISNEFSNTKGTKSSICACQGYMYEKEPASFGDEPFLSRKAKKNEEICFYGKLAIDVFTCDKFLLPNVKIRLRLVRSRPNFYIITNQNKNFSCSILQASLFTRQVVIEDRIFKDLHSSLQLRPARYNFSEVLAKTFVIPNGQNQYIHENIFNNAPIRRLAIAMNTNTAFTGSLKTNPFHYQKFNLRSIRIVRGSHVVVDMDTTDNVQSYITTMRALKFDEDGPGIPLEEYPEHFVQVFDLTSTQEANVQIYYPDVIAASLRLELYFTSPLPSATEVAVFGERLSTIFIDKTGTVVKNG